MTPKIQRNNLCWCGSGQKYKNCHALIDEKIARYYSNGFEVPHRNLLKSKQQIEGIRESSNKNIAILDFIENYVVEGISTEEIDQLIYYKTKELCGIPATLNYNGYPKSVCISVNNVVCHGIPSKNDFLQNGDIVNIDVSTFYNGYFSDSSRMFLVGDVSSEKQKLVNVARECMNIGIEQIKPWGFLGDIGHAINEYAVKNGYSVVRDIGGHGIGLQFHEDPWICYVARKNTGMLLVPGLVFTVEPMINLGTPNVITNSDDDWTVRTSDGKPSAQWEKTVLVTNDGFEVLAY